MSKIKHEALAITGKRLGNVRGPLVRLIGAGDVVLRGRRGVAGVLRLLAGAGAA